MRLGGAALPAPVRVRLPLVIALVVAGVATVALLAMTSSGTTERAAPSGPVLLHGLPLQAALLGGVPMMLGTGVGSEIRQPLGYAIVGGLALSQVLTLYTTPVVYIYLDRLQSWMFGEKRKQAVPGDAAPVPAE